MSEPIIINKPRQRKRSATILTNRETDVLRLIAGGLSNSEAADRLQVSKRTVDFHLANAFIKLKAKNRVQAIMIAATQKLVRIG